MTQNPHLLRALARLHRESTAEELRAVYEQGATTTQLAAATGRSGGWVTRRLRHADTRMRTRGRRVQPPATPTAQASAMSSPSSTVLRHVLARRLVTLRTQAGLTQTQVAREMDVSHHTMMRAEHPEASVSLDLLRALCVLYDASPQVRGELLGLWRGSRAPEWWTVQGLRVPGGRRTELGLYADARRVHGWADILVPDLVQTAGYAYTIERALDAEGPVEMAVSVRMAAQRRVRRRGIDQRYVVDEAVIRRRVGGVQVMVEQLAVLRVLAERGRLRVLSWDSGHCPPDGPFELCSIPDLGTALRVPLRGEVHIGEPPPPYRPLRFFQDTMAQLWDQAQDSGATLALIEDAHARLHAEGAPPAPTASTR